MKSILFLFTLPLIIAGCAYGTAGTTRTTTTQTVYTHFTPTNGIPVFQTNVLVTVTETTHGTSYGLFDANASLDKVSIHSGYATNANGSFSPGINAAGINNTASSSNFVMIVNAAGQIVNKIPF